MPGRGAAEVADGAIVLFHAYGWLEEKLNEYKISAAVPVGLILIWALACSQVGLADLFWLGCVILLLPAVAVVSFLLRARGQRLVANDNGLHRDTDGVPFWMRPFTPAWSLRWPEILRVDVRQIDLHSGRGGPHTTIEMRFVLRDGRSIRLRPRYWLTSAGIAEQPTIQRLEHLPSAATPVGRALEQWAPDAPVRTAT